MNVYANNCIESYTDCQFNILLIFIFMNFYINFIFMCAKSTFRFIQEDNDKSKCIFLD